MITFNISKPNFNKIEHVSYVLSNQFNIVLDHKLYDLNNC